MNNLATSRILTNLLTAGFEEELVGPIVVGAVGEFGLGEGLFELFVEVEAPLVYFLPGNFGAFDLEKFFAVFGLLDAEVGFAEGGDAAEEEADQMHGVFPFDLAVGAEVLFEFFKLAGDVSVVGLVDEFAEKLLAVIEEFAGERSGVFDERGIKAFEDVGIGFKGHR